MERRRFFGLREDDGTYSSSVSFASLCPSASSSKSWGATGTLRLRKARVERVMNGKELFTVGNTGCGVGCGTKEVGGVGSIVSAAWGFGSHSKLSRG